MNRLNLWIKAYANSQTFDYSAAITAFRQLLEESSPLRNNTLIMINLGETYYYSGDVTNAKIILQQVKTFFLVQRLISLIFFLSFTAFDFRPLMQILLVIEAMV